MSISIVLVDIVQRDWSNDGTFSEAIEPRRRLDVLVPATEPQSEEATLSFCRFVLVLFSIDNA